MKKILLFATVLTFAISACDKTPLTQNKSQLNEQSSKLIIGWTDLQFRLIKITTGVTHVAYSRHFSYTGIAVY